MFEVILILFDPMKGTYHAALFYEAPFPGPPGAVPNVARMRSKMHHTAGAPTLEGAQVHADELSARIPSAKLLRDRVEAFDSTDPATTILMDARELAA
jgi:hypothetical protein